MRSLSRVLLVLFLFLSLSGCVGQEVRLGQEGQYAAQEKLLEGRIKDISSASTTDLFSLCNAYAAQSKFNKLIPCLDQWEKNIQRGDRYMEFGMGVKMDVTRYYYGQRAATYQALGDNDRAKEFEGRMNDLPNDLPDIEYQGLAKIMLDTKAVQQAKEASRTQAYANEGDLLNAIKYATLGENEKGDERVKFFNKSMEYLREYSRKTYKWTGVYPLGDELSIGSTKSPFSVINIAEWHIKLLIYKYQYETGNTKDAKIGYERLLAIPQFKQSRVIYWQTLYDRGRVAEIEKNSKEAIDFYKKAGDVIEAMRSSINFEAGKIGFVEDKQKVYQHLIAALFNDGRYAEAFEYVERSKARALVDMLAFKQDFAAGKGDRQQATLAMKDLETVEQEGISQQAADKTQVNMAQSEQIKTRSIQIRQRLKAASPELASLVTSTTVSEAEMRSQIPADTTLIEYYYYKNDDMYAFVLTRDNIRAVKLSGAGLAKDVERFREALQDVKSNRYVEPSRALYDRLIKPVESLALTRNLIIVPHGALHYLPFNALNSGGSGGYLIDRYTVSTLPSASVMSYLKDTQARKTRQALVLGNPALDDPAYNLKYAGEEAVAVAKTFPQSRVLLQKDATKTAFMALSGSYNYIHFATHALYDAARPLNSGLMLAKDGADGGFLSVGELYSLSLDAELVTLSACETGLGRISNGDDVVGLIRGFLYAGSGAIVSSLWKVDDMATSYLMTEFYTGLDKSNRRDALRRAQIAAKKKYEHPFFWAAFQLTGRQ
jgi:CHAT domain-containing protein